MSVSGHKSVQSLTIYQCVEGKEKLDMAKTLSKSFTTPPTTEKKAPTAAQSSLNNFQLNTTTENSSLPQVKNKNSAPNFPANTQLVPFDPNLDDALDTDFDLVKILEDMERAKMHK